MSAITFRAVGRTFAVLGLALSILSTPTFSPVARAANTACAPTSSKSNSADRIYTFTGVTICDWTIPAGWTSFTAEIVGGGGGGGGGSWAGSTGGGGGGGAPGSKQTVAITATAGSAVTISIGAGGAAGSGAASQGSTTGNNGASGGLTSFAFSTSDSYTAKGGGGGFGASSDTGGAGGIGGGFKNGATIFDEVNGGVQNSGNGGEGKVAQGFASAATSSYPGWSGTSNGYGNKVGVKGGGGGARTGTNLDAGTNGNSSGGSSTNTAQAGSSNTGSGGGGGAGCSAASATCANRSGGAGAAGYVIIYRDFGLAILNQNRVSSDPAVNTSSMAVGVTPTFPTVSVLAPLGSVTYSVSPALPPGLSFNTSTAVLSGVPTAATAQAFYTFSATDSFGTFQTSWPLVINKGTGTAPTFSGGNLVFGVATALTASGGTGTGALTFSTSSTDCVLSGSRGETVTAQKASGTCTIVAQKAGDANWYSASKSASFSMTKRPSTLAISVSPTSPREAGTTMTISATVGSGQTGTVTFSANSSAITTCGTSGAVTISGTSASCSWIPSASGSPFTLTASYGGDSNYQSVSSNSLSFTVYPSIAISYPGISTTFGTAKSSTPSVTGGTGSTSSWGWTIAKASDASAVTGISINGSGVVSAATNTASGTYSMQVTATDTVGITKSALVNVTVGLSNAASPSITSSVSSTTAGGVIRLSASVLASATGTMAFKYGATTITSCGSVAISSGNATCDWTTPSAAGSPYSVTAVYSGDANFATSTTSTLTITVLAPGVFTYTSQNKVFGDGATASPSISGGSGTFSTWTVVSATDSNTVLGISINGAGVITVAQNLAAGSYNMRISASDSNGVSGTGSFQIVITQATTTMTLSARTITGTILTGGSLGRQVRLFVALSNPISGSITFSDARGTICTAFASSFSAECWWGPSDATYSPYAITATFAGNSNATAATSNTLTNFIWNPSMSVSHANTSVETGKTVNIAPTVSGGTGATSTWLWSISQYLTGSTIGGITINSSGVITVSGSVAPGTYTMVVQSGDLAGAYFYNNVTITVSNLVAPDISISITSETVTAGSAITGYTITNTGSDITSYEIDQSLPGGLSFSASTGRITGTPTETATALVITLTANNFAGQDTATYTLTISAAGGGGGGATISISLTGGAVTVAKGTAITITATVSTAGKVKFFANGKVIGGCAAKSATTSATCSWKPAIQGQNVALTALLNPTSGSFSNVRSSELNVGVTRRSGRR